jgi:hypothetical protein
MITKTFFLAKIIHRIGVRSLRNKKVYAKTWLDNGALSAMRATGHHTSVAATIIRAPQPCLPHRLDRRPVTAADGVLEGPPRPACPPSGSCALAADPARHHPFGPNGARLISTSGVSSPGSAVTAARFVLPIP